MGDKEKLFSDWQSLYDTVPPLLGEDEKTLAMIARELGVRSVTAKRYIEQWMEEGKIEPVGLRRIGATAPTDAYRVVKG